MNLDIARLEVALARLVGLPLRTAHRALDMQIFRFGEPRTRTTQFGPRKGETAEVCEYSLHLQCTWRIRGDAGIVVASSDLRYVAGPDPYDIADDWDGKDSRRDVRLRTWLEGAEFMVEHVSADSVGGFTMLFAGGLGLDVFPDHSLDGEYSEHWRLVRTLDAASEHFVVSGDGIYE